MIVVYMRMRGEVVASKIIVVVATNQITIPSLCVVFKQSRHIKTKLYEKGYYICLLLLSCWYQLLSHVLFDILNANLIPVKDARCQGCHYPRVLKNL